jgi:hypothetical protein
MNEDQDYTDLVKESREERQMRDDDELYEMAERRELWMEIWEQHHNENY